MNHMKYAIDIVETVLDNSLNKNCNFYKMYKSMPRWYRGLSSFQQKAGDKLSNAIRDDLEQQTSYRVLRLLDSIGLRPMVTGRQLKPVMEMSRGNNLAFLWFLMEMYYKSDDGIYSSNEQIIMSLIFRLDLYPTLRQLDRILPLGHPAKEDIEAAKIKEQQRKRESEKQKRLRMKTKSARNYQLPYFQPLVEPKLYGPKLTATRPPSRLSGLEVPKEEFGPSSVRLRWFAHYNVGSSEPIAKNIIHEEIDKIFDKLRIGGVQDEHVVTLCKRHKLIDGVERSLAKKLKVIAHEQMQRYLDVDIKKREERQKRIVKDLEKASACFRARFHEMALQQRIEATRKELFVRNKSDICDDKPAFICLTGNTLNNVNSKRLEGGAEKRNRKKIKRQQTKSKKLQRKKKFIGCTDENLPDELNGNICNKCGGLEKGGGDCETTELEFVGNDIRECADGGIKYIRNAETSFKLKEDKRDIGAGECVKICTSQDCLQEAAKCIAEQLGFDDKSSTKKKKVKLEVFNFEENDENCQRCNWQQQEQQQRQQQTDTECIYCRQEANKDLDKGNYFSMPTAYDKNPYYFNYAKIFNNKTINAEELNIKSKFVEAVSSDIEILNQLMDETFTPADATNLINATINRETKRVFDEDVEFFEKEYKRREMHEIGPKNRLNFGQKIFDPYNREMMTNMLRLALERISEDHRYVLPTLPDVWNVPVLQNWIAQRYGRNFSTKERTDIYNSVRPLMLSLSELLTDWVLPRTNMKQKQIYKMVPYEKHDCLMNMADKLRENYLNLFSEIVMEIGRLFFFSMSPGLYNNSKVDTFFAYMPARYFDVAGFSVMQKHEQSRFRH